jgi:MoxR-like ATPase
VKVLERQQFHHPIEDLVPVVSEVEVLQAQDDVRKIYVAPGVKRYIVELNRRTREFPEVYLGASPRGSLTLYRACQARAALQGREFVLPDDVKALAEASLGHRVILGPGARLRDLSTSEVVQEILSGVAVPGGDLVSEV